MNTLYLHIGLPKTGTTAIQDFCWQNRDHLKKKYALIYPLNDHMPLAHGLFRFLEEGKKASSKLSRVYLKEVFRLRQICANCEENESVLISSEWLTEPLHYETCIQTLIQDLNVPVEKIKIIVYLRRQDKQLQSFATQKITYDSRIEINDYRFLLERIGPVKDGYDRFCEKLSSIVGEKNLRVRIYERQSLIDQDVISDFLDVLNIPRDVDFKPLIKSSNPSLPAKFVLFRLKLNPLFRHCRLEHFFLFPSKMYVQHKESGSGQGVLSPQVRLDLLTDYDASNRRTAKLYFPNGPGTLFSEPLPFVSAESSSELSEHEMVQIFNHLAADFPVRAVLVSRAIEQGLMAPPGKVRSAAEAVKFLLERQRFKNITSFLRKCPRKMLALFRLPGLRQWLSIMLRISETVLP